MAIPWKISTRQTLPSKSLSAWHFARSYLKQPACKDKASSRHKDTRCTVSRNVHMLLHAACCKAQGTSAKIQRIELLQQHVTKIPRFTMVSHYFCCPSVSYSSVSYSTFWDSHYCPTDNWKFQFRSQGFVVRGLQYSSDGYISATVILGTFLGASPGARLWEQVNATWRPDRLRADPFLHILHNQAQFIRHLCELPFQTWIPCTPTAPFPVRILSHREGFPTS